MSRQKTYSISLTKEEEKNLKHIIKRSSSSNRRKRCTIILNANEINGEKTYDQIAKMSGCSSATVITTIREYCINGLDAALTPKRNEMSNVSRIKATGDVEARVIAKACSSVPKGYVRWTLSMLTEEMSVVLEDRLSRATIGRILQKNEIKPHLNDYWCIPPNEDADFVAAMEDILDVYQLPHDPKRPVWCMDEKPYQLLDESRKPLPMRPGDIRKIDSEYVRNGTVSVFCFIQPHTGRIIHAVEPTRTAVDWAEKIKFLVDEVCPEVEKIILVMDNLNTHTIGSLYKAFKPAEARRIARKLEVHYTPKHGSWLDIAEIGINIMTRECLNRRIAGIEELRSELKAWNDKYNSDPSPVNWQYTVEKSRIKLTQLYPNIEKHIQDRDARRQEKENSAQGQTTN